MRKKDLNYYKLLLQKARQDVEVAQKQLDLAKENYDKALMQELHRLAKVKGMSVEQLLDQVKDNQSSTGMIHNEQTKTL